MHFRPLHSSTRRVLPAVGFLTAVQMATHPALAGPGDMEGASEPMAASAVAQAPSRMSRIVGAAVCDAQGERIGEVRDIVLDGHGALAYAIVATQDSAGIGDRWHAVPWQAMSVQAASQGEPGWVLNAGRPALARDAGFSPQAWPDFSDAMWRAGNLRHYGLSAGNT